VEAFCGCIEGANLADLMEGDGGYPGNEMSFSTQSGGQGVSWWFESGASFLVCYKDTVNQACKDKDLIPKDSKGEEIEGICRIAANVFVGDPAAEPGHFMAGTIDIKIKENDVDKIFGLDENKKFEDLTADDIKKLFYDEDENGNFVLKNVANISGYNSDIFELSELESGSTLDPEALKSDRINLVFLKGDLDVELSDSFKDKQLIIVSKNESNIDFSVQNGSDRGQGAGAGGIEGWIIAPDGGVYTPSGTPKIHMNVNVTTCQTGAHSDRCFESAGGSGFKGDFGSDDFKEPEAEDGSDDESTGNVKVDSSEEMEINFDY